MARRRLTDTFVLLPLAGLWLVAAVLHVRQVATGQLAWVGVYVHAAPTLDDAPTVRGFWPGAAPEEFGTLEIGDRLWRVADVDLRGRGPFAFAARVHAVVAAQRSLRVPIVYERAGSWHETTIGLVPVVFPWRMLPLTSALVVIATLVLLRRPGEAIARMFFLVAVAFGLHWTFFFGGPPAQTYAWMAVFGVASTVMLPLVLHAVLVFPAETAPAPGAVPRWPWVFAVFGPISTSWLYGIPFAPAVGFRAVFFVNIAVIVTILGVMTRNYRRAGPIGRRQLKWVMLGMYAGTVPVLLADVVGAIDPRLWWVHEVAAIAEIAIPICVLIAVVRTNSFDVDRLITLAAVASLLSMGLLAGVLIAIPQVARMASRAIGGDVRTLQIALSVLVAAALVPMQRVLQPGVERVVFQERWALRAGVEALLHDLGDAANPAALFTLVGERLDALVRPRLCTIYVPDGDAVTPIFVRGDPEAAAVDPAALVVSLRAGFVPTDPRQRTVVIPVRVDGTLTAAICLGGKRSGDVYTPVDLALLGAVADKVAGELSRFDLATVLRHERAMGEALRQYVPQTVAARLSRGETVESEEREVSVLFADIRGYTTWSEREAPEAAFAMVNAYTEAVSQVVRGHGGTVVEFLGDGIMAVFGAPDALPDHARIAVATARDVVAAVRDLSRTNDLTRGAIDVGVGVATGRAFVGNVRTGERLVYTAIGDVVNLASRIQGLTRDLHAAVAIDAATFAKAGRLGARFAEHPAMRVRGRAEPVDVYALGATGRRPIRRPRRTVWRGS